MNFLRRGSLPFLAATRNNVRYDQLNLVDRSKITTIRRHQGGQPVLRFNIPSVDEPVYPGGHRSLPMTNKLRQLIDTTEPNVYLHSIIKGTNVLLLCNHNNTLTKRVENELKDHDVWVNVREVRGKNDFLQAARDIQHDIIICPFLTKRIPREIWDNPDIPCLIVHPGIPGDRGASSIDWALKMQASEWGVTVVEAADEMDAGDIWAGKTFRITNAALTKTEMYVGDITDAAVEAVLLALVRFRLKISPIPLSYDNTDVKGTLMPLMKDKDRMIDWNESAFAVAETVRMADTQPGGIGMLYGDSRILRFYGANYFENLMFSGKRIRDLMNKAENGEVLGFKDEAILVKCGDNNGIWISHLKDPTDEKPLKLPATMVYDCKNRVPNLSFLTSYREIWIEEKDKFAYVHFDFYNGAMNVKQCNRLQSALEELSTRQDINAVVLMGGYRFFSTGIHLNVIEGSNDPIQESYDNIVAIDDVIKTVFSMQDKLTISCLAGNAGAGGVMMAAASDFVVSHKGVVLTPTYKSMHLYGSEYWTYFLPQRVGQEHAIMMTDSTKSMMATKAKQLGLVDRLIGRNRPELLGNIHVNIQEIVSSDEALEKRQIKKQRNHEWLMLLEEHRKDELEKMEVCFKSEEYHKARKDFVYH